LHFYSSGEKIENPGDNSFNVFGRKLKGKVLKFYLKILFKKKPIEKLELESRI
jgi:hypothetical protein